MMKRILSILLALAILLSVSAVFAEAEEPAAEEPAAVPDTLLVTVNGQEIRENDEQLQSYLAEMLSSLGSEDGDALRVARMCAMSYMLQEAMLSEKIASRPEAEVEETRQHLKEDWDNIITQFMAQLSGITDESSEEDKTAARADALNYIETNYGYTEEKYIKAQLFNTAYNMILDELKASRTDLAATDDEIQASYDDIVKEEMEIVGNDAAMYEMYQNYYGYTFHYIPEGYRGIIHILLKVDEELLNNWTDLSARLEESHEETENTGDTDETETPAETEEPVTEEMVEAARQAILDSQKETIDEILARFEKGDSFESLISEFGTDTGMQDEDNLKNGYSIHPDSIIYDENFTKAAASLGKVGDISDPVISQFGIHILYYLRDIPAGPLDMSDEEKEELRSEIEEERVSLAFSEYYDQWLGNADVVWTAEGETWKFDQEFYNNFFNPADEDADEAESETEPADEAEAESSAEEETAAEPEEATAP